MPTTDDERQGHRPVTAIQVAQDAVEAAQEKYAESASMGDAINAALAKMGFRREWAVPCLDAEGDCRSIYLDLPSAQEHAERVGHGVVEVRESGPWRILRD